MPSGASQRASTRTSTIWNTCVLAGFYKQFCSILGVPEKDGKPAMFKVIQEHISYLYRDKHQPLLLVIYEAQYLNNVILNDIKMLMNYGYDSVNCFTLKLCGESHLNDIPRKPIHEALHQHITINYNYEGLDGHEVSEYILHKLNCAGASRSIIRETALGVFIILVRSASDRQSHDRCTGHRCSAGTPGHR